MNKYLSPFLLPPVIPVIVDSKMRWRLLQCNEEAKTNNKTIILKPADFAAGNNR